MSNNEIASELPYGFIADHLVRIVLDTFAELPSPGGDVSVSAESLDYFRRSFAQYGSGTAARIRIPGKDDFANVDVDFSRGRWRIQASHWSGSAEDPQAIAHRAHALSVAAALMARMRAYLDTLAPKS